MPNQRYLFLYFSGTAFQILLLRIIVVVHVDIDVDVVSSQPIGACTSTYRTAAVEDTKIQKRKKYKKNTKIQTSEPARALAGQQQLKILQSLDVSQRHPQTRPKTTPRRKMPVLTPPNEGTLRQKLSPRRQILFSSDRPCARPLSASARLLSASSSWSSSVFFSSNIS